MMRAAKALFLPSPACGRGVGGEGAQASNPEFPLYECRQIIGVHRGVSLDPNDSPARSFNRGRAVRVSQGDLAQAVNAAVDLDDDLSTDDRKIDDMADRMLAPNSEADVAQGPDCVPSGGFGGVCLLPQAASEPRLLSFAHRDVVRLMDDARNSSAPHPRPLSRKRERGEEGALACLRS